MVTITILIVSGSSCSHNCLSEAISAHLSYSYLVSLMREKLTGDNRLSGHPAMQFTCCINLVGHVCEPWTYLPPPPCIAPTTTGPLIGGVVSLVVLILISIAIIIPVTVYCIYKQRRKAGSTIGEGCGKKAADDLYEEIDSLPQQQTGDAVTIKAYGDARTQPLDPTLDYD